MCGHQMAAGPEVGWDAAERQQELLGPAGTDDIHEAFLSLACSIICWRRLKKLSLC
jgi:hypothetical protein